MLKHPFCALQGSLHGRVGAMIAGKQHAVDLNVVQHALVVMGVRLWQRMTNGGRRQRFPTVHAFAKPRSQFRFDSLDVGLKSGPAKQRGHDPVLTARVWVQIGWYMDMHHVVTF